MIQHIQKVWYRLIRGGSFLPLPTQSLREKYARELRQQIASLKHAGTDSLSDWQDNMRELAHEIETHDPVNFLDWQVIRKTMFHVAAPSELRALQRNDWPTWKKTLRESAVGNPPPYPMLPFSSGNLIHHAYNFLQLEKTFGIKIREMHSILEFGGGYGSMARLAYGLGFGGTYGILDLPEFSAIQKYFLSMVGILSGEKNKIALFSDIEKTSQFKNPDICIMTWSLSESPLEVRKKFLDHVGSPRYVLIAYQAEFCGIDNRAYFSSLQESRPEYRWVEYEIPHIQGNYYLLGKKER